MEERRRSGQRKGSQKRSAARRSVQGQRYLEGEYARPAKKGNKSSAGRRRRRKKRLIKALTAWAVCLFLVGVIAAGTVRFVGTMTSRKKMQFRQDGLEQMASGNYSGAVEAFDKALESSKKGAETFNRDVLLYRAEAELRLGDYEAAVHSYDLLLEMEPESAFLRYMKSICYAQAGEVEQAYAMYHEAVSKEQEKEDSEGQMQALVAVGSACVSAEEYERGAALYESALNSGIANGEIYNQMGICQMAEGAYEDAFDSFDKGYEVIAAQYKMGAGTAPSQVLGVVPQENSKDAGILKELTFNRAVACEYLQQYEKALDLFQAYIDAFGSEEEAQHEIDFLKTR